VAQARQLIRESYVTHKHPEVRAWLEKHPRFRIHFTPTFWLIMVKRTRHADPIVSDRMLDAGCRGPGVAELLAILVLVEADMTLFHLELAADEPRQSELRAVQRHDPAGWPS